MQHQTSTDMINKKLGCDVSQSFLKDHRGGLKSIHRICVTGGACAGKTTALATIS